MLNHKAHEQTQNKTIIRKKLHNEHRKPWRHWPNTTICLTYISTGMTLQLFLSAQDPSGHWNFPSTTSPDSTTAPHPDPEVMFSSLAQPDALDGSSNHLSSTTMIHNLMDNDDTTEDEQPQVPNIKKQEGSWRLEDLSPSEFVELPKAKQRTSVVVDGCVPQGRLWEAYARRGEGIAQARYRLPLIVKATHRLARLGQGNAPG